MPPKHIFKGQTFAISGTLSQPRKEYEELIKKWGGEVASSLTKAVTFLITTEVDVKSGSAKVVTAKERGTPIVQEGFIGACITAKKFLKPEKFAITAATKRKAAAKPPASPKKSKTAGKPIVTTDKIKVISKPGVGGGYEKAQVVVEDITHGFVKAQLTWDVQLCYNDCDKGIDKFYNIQLLVADDSCWVATHWGKTGMAGQVQVDGAWDDIDYGKKAFRKKYRQKTGNQWGTLGSFAEVPGKYKLLARDDEADSASVAGRAEVEKRAEADKGPGKWQYYLHNKVDGKKIGWYDYEDAGAANMEKYWWQFRKNDASLAIRFIQSDYFKYEVNYDEMHQTNTKSGTRRVIRRVPAGERPSPAPPAKIPESVKPRKEYVSEEEEENSEEEDDDDEEEDAAEEDAPEEDAAEEDGGAEKPEADVEEAAPKRGVADDAGGADKDDGPKREAAETVTPTRGGAADALPTRGDTVADTVTGDDEDMMDAETLVLPSR